MRTSLILCMVWGFISAVVGFPIYDSWSRKWSFKNLGVVVVGSLLISIGCNILGIE